ncbi:MAG: hypothetical protein WCK93_00005 [Nitrosomonadales bacterium]|jgi:predicted trehalose synthase
MKNVKLLLAGLVLCASQAAFALITPTQETAISAQIAALDVTNQATVTAVINAAAAAGISVEDIAASLTARQVPASMIATGINANISMGGGYTSAGSATILALLGNTGATGAGGTANLASLGSFTTGGFTGSPNGAVSGH